jgi:hypothetical protein
VAITEVALIVPAPVDDFDYTTTNSMSACVTDLSTLGGSLISRLEDHLRTSASILQAQFGEVLVGRAWTPDQLDWCGMK